MNKVVVNKWVVVALNIQMVLIVSGIFVVLGLSAWFDLDVRQEGKAIMEFVVFLAIVTNISLCIYNIKSARRNNWG